MHEMLGHHDFLLRRYGSALAHYEKVIAWGAPSKAVRKRAVVCYIQTRQPEKALPLFTALIAEDAAYILGQEGEREGCPCPQIIQEYVNRVTNSITQADTIALGMLWSYCDPQVSVLWFNRAIQQQPENPSLKTILVAFSSYRVNLSSSHETPIERT
jgi:hypothetical protein